MDSNYELALTTLESAFNHSYPGVGRFWANDLFCRVSDNLKNSHSIISEVSSRLVVPSVDTVMKIEYYHDSYRRCSSQNPSPDHQNINERTVIRLLPEYEKFLPRLVGAGEVEVRTIRDQSIWFSYNIYEKVNFLADGWDNIPSDAQDFKDLLVEHGSYWAEVDTLEHWGFRDDGAALLLDFG